MTDNPLKTTNAEPKVYSVNLEKHTCFHKFRREGINIRCILCNVFYKDMGYKFPVEEANKYYEQLKKTFTPSHS